MASYVNRLMINTIFDASAQTGTGRWQTIDETQDVIERQGFPLALRCDDPPGIDLKRITADTESRGRLTGLRPAGNTVTIPQTNYAKRLNATLSTTGEAFSEQASTQAILLSCSVHFPFRLLGQQPT
jgi:hypothetical protein